MKCFFYEALSFFGYLAPNCIIDNTSLARLRGTGRNAVIVAEMERFAGGIGFMLSCDIIIARNDVFFCTPEINVGIFPMMVGALIYRDVQRKKALEMVLTGRRISAPEAERMGLITRAVERARLDEEVGEALKLLTAKSPIAMKIGKEAFRVISDMPFEDAVDHLCEALGKVIATEDAKEGMTAFLEKRQPQFKGR